jgi:hypothetical protein
MQTFTLPYIPNYPGLYLDIHNQWASIVSSYLDNLAHLTAQCSMDLQPVPSIIGQHSEDRGGNAIGLSGDDPARLFVELQCSWSDPADDATVYDLTEQVTDWMQAQMAGWIAQAGLGLDAYFPFFHDRCYG